MRGPGRGAGAPEVPRVEEMLWWKWLSRRAGRLVMMEVGGGDTAEWSEGSTSDAGNRGVRVWLEYQVDTEAILDCGRRPG